MSPQSLPRRTVDDLADYLQQVVGQPVAEPLLTRALTHRSFAYEQGGLPHNERLEFLGDSVLGLVVTDALYTTHPDLPEGQLAKLRAAVVNRGALATVARTLSLGSCVLLGRGEESTGGRDKDSILADTMEAVIGAAYLTGGLPAGSRLVHHLFDPLMAASLHLGAGLDWKTSLQELAANLGAGSPDYEVDETGPDHAKSFVATALLGSRAVGSGSGRSKKEAEQRAAAQAWTSLHARPVGAPPALPPAANA